MMLAIFFLIVLNVEGLLGKVKCDGGGGFFSLARILGECSIIHSPSALFFCFEVEISSQI